MKKWLLTPDKFLSLDEVKKLQTMLEEQAIVAQVKGRKKPIRDWAIMDVALFAGLRASEICNLKMKDVYVGKGEYAILVEKGKGNKKRVVTIGDDLKKHLKKYICWKKKVNEPVGPHDYLFVSERSPKMTLSAIQRVFKGCAKACGLKREYSIHSARHTYGTMLYRATKDLRMVQKQLGHSSCQVTEVYADVLAEDMQVAVNGLYA